MCHLPLNIGSARNNGMWAYFLLVMPVAEHDARYQMQPMQGKPVIGFFHSCNLCSRVYQPVFYYLPRVLISRSSGFFDYLTRVVDAKRWMAERRLTNFD